MEQQLADLNIKLAKERATILSLKDDNRRSLEQFQVENVQLRENLAKVLKSNILSCMATNCTGMLYSERYHHIVLPRLPSQKLSAA